MALTLESLKPIFPKYEYKYTDRPQEACTTYLSKKNPYNLLSCKYKGLSEQEAPKFIDWKGKSRGLFFHHPTGNPNVFCVKLSEDCKKPPPVICRERTRTRCTQTRYRESSAQTRSYQPEVAGDKKTYQQFEVYEISKLLDTIVPPGEYEAKVVERHRRRRKYEKALQLTKNDPEKHKTILEAMEWDEWVAREEDIQGCQMLRMEIVIRMFEEREEKFRVMSEQRILCSAERIQLKRTLQLTKINVEYSRGIRRLEAQKQKITRCYRKGNITQEHIDPASDLHAPQMRFGVNPNRRHFVGFRKKFNDRINDLDKQKDERGLASLICPFSKLKSWAKPKEQMKEVSQRFCSDENLKNLYESLKGLRTISETPRPNPKCLKKKVKPPQHEIGEQTPATPKKETDKSKMGREEQADMFDENEEEAPSKEELTNNLRRRRAQELASKDSTEIASIIGHFEGKTLGTLLQFLSDELDRLKQQKKFQAIYMLAERERWRREAEEAGIRQKENKAREDQEKLFKAASDVHRDTATLFLESVLEEEFKITSEILAKEKIDDVARDIDYQDLESIKLQGKEKRNYDRATIADYVESQVFHVAAARAKKNRTDKLEETKLAAIEEELMADVQRALCQKYQIPDRISIVGDLLDELIIDAVTYDFDIITPDTSDDEFDTEREIDEVVNKLIKAAIRFPGVKDVFTDSTEYEEHLIGEKEAKAVMRKMVRRAVPAERWKKEVDRIVEQTVSETFNDAVYEVECLKASRFVRANDRLNEVISEIYKRCGWCQTHASQMPEEPESVVSVFLKSIPSDYNIFDLASCRPSEEISLDDDLPRRSMRKIDYIDPAELEKFTPPEIDHRHERYDIMGKVAKRYRPEDIDDNNLQIFGDASDLSLSTSSSEEGVVGYSSKYLEVVKSRIFSSPWLQSMHPELLIKSSSSDSAPPDGNNKEQFEEHQSYRSDTASNRKRKDSQQGRRKSS